MKKIINNPSTDDAEYDKFGAVSSNDCTGLITVPPENEDELENYMKVYDFGPPLTEKTKKNNE